MRIRATTRGRAAKRIPCGDTPHGDLRVAGHDDPADQYAVVLTWEEHQVAEHAREHDERVRRQRMATAAQIAELEAAHREREEARIAERVEALKRGDVELLEPKRPEQPPAIDLDAYKDVYLEVAVNASGYPMRGWPGGRNPRWPGGGATMMC